MKNTKKTILTFVLLIQIFNIFGQNNGGYYSKIINKFNSKFNQNIVSDLILDDKQILWVITPTSIFQYNGAEIKQIESPNKNRAVCFFRTIENKIVLLYSDGKSYYINKDHQLEFYFKDTTQVDFTWNYQFLTAPKKYLKDLFYNEHIKTSYFSCKTSYLSKNEIFYTNRIHSSKSSLELYNFKTKQTIQIYLSGINEKLEYLNVDKSWFKINLKGELESIYNPSNLIIDNLPIKTRTGKKYKLITRPFEPPILISENKVWVLFEKSLNHYQWELVTDQIPLEMSIQNGRYSKELQKLFLATESDGFIIFSKNNFTTFVNPQKIHKSNYYLQIPTKNNEVITNGSSIFMNSPHNNFFSNRVINNNYIFLDETTILTSTATEILTYNFETRKHKIIEQTKENSYSNFIRINNLIYIIGNHKIFKYNPKTEEIEAIFQGKIGYLNINELQFINQRIWVGSTSGFTIFNLKTNQIERKILNNIPIRTISKIKNTYYLCTYGMGIFEIDTSRYHFKPLPLDFNQSIKYSHCVIEDKQNNLWISTNSGLLKLSSQNFIQARKRKKFNPEPEYFDTDDGLLTNEFNGGSSPPFLKLGDSLISLPSIKGIVQFNPYTTKNITTTFQFEINNVTYISKEIPFENNHYTLTSNIEEITIDLDLVFWGNLKNLNLYYELDGIEKLINYSEIHQLKVPINFYNQSKLKFFTYDYFGHKKTIKEINLYKEYPWYLQIKYIILCSILIYLLSFFISRIRTNRINKRNFELEKLIQEKTQEIQNINIQLLSQINQLTELNNANTTYISVINHDIFAPIKYINIIGDKIRQNSTKINKTEIVKQFNHIINSTKRLEVLCSNILNYINTSNTLETTKTEINLHNLVEELRQFLNIGLEINNNTLVNTIAPTTSIQSNKDALNIIFTNLLSNANRFTKNGTIEIQFEETESTYSIIVKDNGKGMSQETLTKIRDKAITVAHRNNFEYQSYGIGYSLVYKMLDFIEATFDINSEINQGTEVTINIDK